MRTDRIARRIDRMRAKMKTAEPVTVQVVYYEELPDGTVQYTDSVTGEVLNPRTVQPIAILGPGLLDAL